MREIKFRVWNPVARSMRFDDYAVLFNGNGLVWLNQSEGTFNAVGNSSVITMQYTGLNDADGTPIFEGDITNNGIVVWIDDEEESEFVGWHLQDIKPNKYDYYETHSFWAYTTPFRVLGNIHENPDLPGK